MSQKANALAVVYLAVWELLTLLARTLTLLIRVWCALVAVQLAVLAQCTCVLEPLLHLHKQEVLATHVWGAKNMIYEHGPRTGAVAVLSYNLI